MIKGLLGECCSPEQVSGKLKLVLGLEIIHEMIYCHSWGDKGRGWELYKFLRTKGKKYRSRGGNREEIREGRSKCCEH